MLKTVNVLVFRIITCKCPLLSLQCRDPLTLKLNYDIENLRVNMLFSMSYTSVIITSVYKTTVFCVNICCFITAFTKYFWLINMPSMDCNGHFSVPKIATGRNFGFLNRTVSPLDLKSLKSPRCNEISHRLAGR